MVVQHNLQAMNSNRMLGITQKTLASSTEKLSSGYKINRAADNAAGLSISEKMRKQIRGLTQASTNAEDGISAVQTAEGALQEVTDMLQRMNELSVQAANGTNSESDRQSIQDEVDQLVTEIDRVSETTKFNELYLLKGDKKADKVKTYEYSQKQYTSNIALYDASGAEVKKGTVLNNASTYYTERTGTVASALDLGTAKADNALVEVTSVKADTVVYVKEDDGSITQIAAGEEIEVGTTIYGRAVDALNDENGHEIKLADITAAMMDGATAGTALADMMKDDGAATPTASATKLTAVSAKAKLDLYKTNALVAGGIETLKAGEKTFKLADATDWNKSVTWAPTAGTEVTSADFAKYANDNQLMDFDGNEIAGNGLYSYFDEDGKYKGGLYRYKDDESPSIKELVEVTSAEIGQYTQQVEKETGALTLTLHVGADATENNQISVKLDAMSASSLGIEGLQVGGKDDTNARNAVETVAAALKQVSEQRSALGAIQNRLEHTIKNLDNIVENTTSAESTIRDTDMATEMVKYSNANILAQAGQSMLAQTNQSNQGVLSLLG